MLEGTSGGLPYEAWKMENSQKELVKEPNRNPVEILEEILDPSHFRNLRVIPKVKISLGSLTKTSYQISRDNLVEPFEIYFSGVLYIMKFLNQIPKINAQKKFSKKSQT